MEKTERAEKAFSRTIKIAANRLERLTERKNAETSKHRRRDVYLAGVIKLETSVPDTKNPKKIIEAIKTGKKKGLDLLVGPEWGLCASAEKPSSTFSVHDYMSFFPPREVLDARKLQCEKPYSPREALKVINALRNATKGSDMVVMPGTMMIYTNSGRLYNVMPVVSNGKLIYSVLKYNDGGSSLFNLGGILKFMHGRSHGYTFKHDGIQFGIEICADSCSLARTTSQNGSKGLDIQILSSCGDRYTISALRRGGYFICSDGTGDGYTRVETSNRKPISPSLVDDDNLIVYSTSMLLHRRREETRRKDRET
jgi:hypothetical protein